MKIPKSPPSFDPFLKRTPIDLWFKPAKPGQIVDDQGRYQHWNELRHRTPPVGFLSVEAWWHSTRLARKSACQTLPCEDKSGGLFSFTEPPILKSLLRYIDMHAGGLLNTSRDTLSESDGQHYLRRSLVEEPFSSSLIEGAITTRDIAKKMIFENRAPASKDELMVLNNFKGMEFVKQIQKENLTPGHIIELHRIITDGTLDRAKDSGRIRIAADNIAVMDDATGEILHQPPDASTLDDRLKSLCDFANAPEDGINFCHPVLKAITLHFMLAYDHPFVDGNGRVARALFYWFLLRSGYWLMEYTSISGVIADAPNAYYKAFLYTETDESDLTYFFLHQAQVIREALERIQAYANEKKHELEKFQSIVSEQNKGHPLNQRQILLVQDFVAEPAAQADIDSHRKLHGVSYLTARQDLEDLAERGLAIKTKAGRTSIYRPADRLAQKLLGKSPRKS